MALPRSHSTLRAVIYARFSSELQREESIADQIEVCRRYIERQGWVLVGTYEDAAISGASSARPGYQKLLSDLDRGTFDVVVVEALDRLSRKLADIAQFFDRLNFLGLKLQSIAHGEITTMHIGVVGMMAQMFLSDLGEKTRRGQLGRARQGKSAGGHAYGYDIIADSRGDRRINEAEAEIIRDIFRSFAEGESPRAIAARLNREGVPGPGGRPWGDTTIRGQVDRGTGLLNNALYIGRMDWNRCSYVKDPQTGKRVARPNPPEQWESVEVPELRIVDDELWHRTKERQKVVRIEMGKDQAGNALNRTHRRQFLLSGLLVCGCCGGAYTIIGKDLYGCATRRAKGTCNNRMTITRPEIEDRVLTGLKDRLMAPELVQAFVTDFEAELRRKSAQAGSERASVQKQLQATERKIAGIVRAIEDGAYTSILKDRLSTLENEKAVIEARLAEINEPTPVRLHPNAPELYRGMVANLAEALSAPETRAEAVEIIRELVDRVELRPNEHGGLVAVLYGDLAAMLRAPRGERRTADDPGHGRPGSLLSVVAGIGFGPLTFRL